ncbi:MAG: hypothetical protein H6730_15830 [Deltaproteobacteria bacterium]|nr:hypothetical protein [Deltaproteobacteria bacterium]
MVSLGGIVNDTLGFFGVKGGAIGYVIDSMPLIGSSSGQLRNLQDMFIETAIGRGTGPIERMMLTGGMGMMPWGMPFAMSSPAMMMPTMAPLCGCGYAGGVQTIDLAQGSSNVPFFSRLLDPRRRMAGDFERMLRSNPQARAQFEMAVGGRISNFDFRNDGKFEIIRMPGYGAGMYGMMNPMAASGLGYFGSMQSAVMSSFGGAMGGFPMFGASSMFGNPFMGLTMGGFMNVLGMQGPAGAGAGMLDNTGARGGWGFGSWNPTAMPGRINNTNPYYENAHQAQASALLADPSLTVEDKVTLLIMLIMNKMDDDIQRQAEYINSIQQQQSSRTNGGGGGKGGKFGMGASGPFGATDGGSNNSPSIDVETMKLKRLIDKRSQMFDMLRQIIDKYNETAKGIIQSIGR